MLTFLVAGAVGYGALLGFMFLMQRDLMYRPDTSRPDLLRAGIAGMREVTLDGGDGLSLLSWYRPPADGAPVIAYFHGNGGHVGYRANRVREAFDPRWGVLLLGYRGYGGNPGSPTEDGLVADARAALDFVAGQGIEPRRIVVYGESLGSGVAVQAAAERAVAAVVLEAPFTSAADVAQRHYPFVPARMLVRDRFDSLARIGAVRAPILVIHGEQDGIVPTALGRALLEAAPEPKEGRFFEAAGHNDLYAYGAGIVVRDFVRRHVEDGRQ